MSSEKRAGAGMFLQMFDNRPGDRKSVEGCSAASDFVQKNEAGGSGVGENAGDFAHFDEESGAAAGEIVARADACKNSVGERKFCLSRGNERSHLRHQDDQSGLPQVGRFAAHVWSSDQKELLAVWFEVKIVGYKTLAFLAEEFFYYRMSTSYQQKFTGVVKFRADITTVRGKLRKTCEDIELSDCSSRAAQSRGFRGDA